MILWLFLMDLVFHVILRCMFAPIGQVNNFLFRLRLSGNGITDLGATALGEALRSANPVPPLLHLALDHNKIGPSGATALLVRVEVMRLSARFFK